MKLTNGLNVFFYFLLAFSANAIAVLSHIALPPDFASAPAPSPTTASEYGSETRLPTVASEYGSEIRSPTAASEYGSETRSPTAASEYGSETRSPTAASEYGSETRSPTTASEYGSETRSSTAASEYGSETRSSTAASEYGSETRSPTATSDGEFYLDAALSAMDTTELMQICGTTSEPELCKSTISSNIEESKVDPTSALKTEIKESIKVVEGGVAKLKALRGESAASKVEMACYDTCLENYDLAIFDLKTGLESIDAKDTGTMESVLAAVETNLVTCDDTFVEMGVDSPLENLSTKMRKYAANCLEISKLLL